LMKLETVFSRASIAAWTPARRATCSRQSKIDPAAAEKAENSATYRWRASSYELNWPQQ
jgi:hypothetical protein